MIPMGGPPNHQCKIMLRNDGTAKTPVNGFQYISEPGGVYLPYDLPALVPDDDDEQSGCEPKPTTLTGDPIQRSDRPQDEAVEFAVLNKIANVEPNDWDQDQRKQEMWIIHSQKHEPIGIYCTPNGWDEAKQSFEQVKECGRATFLTSGTRPTPTSNRRANDTKPS